MPMNLVDVRQRFTRAEQAEIDRAAREIVDEHKTLAELRRLVGLTQAELATALDTTQGNVAQIEAKQDVLVSTLARIVSALGGRLELRVALPGRPSIMLDLAQNAGALTLKKTRRPRTTARPQSSAQGRPSNRRAQAVSR